MLEEYLDAKPLYYDEIDYERMPRIYEKIKKQIKIPKIIHLIGTNGKGTTGRFLASALYSLGFGVGHYTSPHILNFNERVWLNSQNVDNKDLDSAHAYLLEILSDEDADALSYFEYTTLVAMIIFQDLEYVVLEAGLGGEHDATAVFAKTLTLVTPIDIDHEAFLGNTIKEIAKTKLNAVQNRAILATQPHKEVYEIASTLAGEKSLEVYKIDEILQDRDYANAEMISKELSLVPYLQENLKLSIAALRFLGLEYRIESFKESRLFGRLTQFKENILLDVGHNTLAASSILQSLKGKKYILIYNSYRDKNYKEILSILKPIIKHVMIIDIDDARVEQKQVMQNTLEELEIEYKTFTEIEPDENYLVFGSFKVVEEFLGAYDE